MTTNRLELLRVRGNLTQNRLSNLSRPTKSNKMSKTKSKAKVRGKRVESKVLGMRASKLMVQRRNWDCRNLSECSKQGEEVESNRGCRSSKAKSEKKPVPGVNRSRVWITWRISKKESYWLKCEAMAKMVKKSTRSFQSGPSISLIAQKIH